MDNSTRARSTSVRIPDPRKRELLRFGIRLAVIWAIEVVGLFFMAWLLPGVRVDGLMAAVLAVQQLAFLLHHGSAMEIVDVQIVASILSVIGCELFLRLSNRGAPAAAGRCETTSCQRRFQLSASLIATPAEVPFRSAAAPSPAIPVTNSAAVRAGTNRPANRAREARGVATSGGPAPRAVRKSLISAP